MKERSSRRECVVALVLVVCVALVAAWELASRYASRPQDALRLSAEDFSGFEPSFPGWQIRLVHVKATPTEPTIVGYDVRPQEPHSSRLSSPVFVRIVHGYNMVDCMRIKQYRVEIMEDTLRRGRAPGVAAGKRLPMQLWRLLSPSGESSVWATTMLRASDLAATDDDTRDMPFPRVGTPDDPAWAPSGLRWRSFRNPVRNFRLFLRSKWNASRADLLTFLRLRQPAWASDVLLTMVSTYRGSALTDPETQQAAAYVQEVHQTFYEQLRHYPLSVRKP